MIALKSLSLLLGEQMLVIQNVSHKNDTVTETPIFLDEEKNRVIQQQSATKRQVIDLNKVLMYSYEVLEPQVTQ